MHFPSTKALVLSLLASGPLAVAAPSQAPPGGEHFSTDEDKVWIFTNESFQLFALYSWSSHAVTTATRTLLPDVAGLRRPSLRLQSGWQLERRQPVVAQLRTRRIGRSRQTHRSIQTRSLTLTTQTRIGPIQTIPTRTTPIQTAPTRTTPILRSRNRIPVIQRISQLPAIPQRRK